MREVRILLGMELRSLFGINRFFHTTDKKEKRRFRLLACAWAFLALLFLVYDAGIALALCMLGMHSCIPGLMTMLASVIILVFGVFKAGHRIFGNKGYDLLISLPVHPRSIMLSRFLSLYLADLIWTMGVFVPGLVVMALSVSLPVRLYLRAFLIMLLVPAVPLMLSTVIGTLVSALTARMKRKSLPQTALMMAFTFGLLFLSFKANQMDDLITDELMMNLATAAEGLAARVYPPAQWANLALMELQLLPLLGFVALSLAVLALGIWLSGRAFPRIMRRMNATSAGRVYKLSKLGRQSRLRALYRREAKRYFSSPIYVTNTIIGPAMGIILSVALCMGALSNVTAVLPFDISGMLPVLLSAVLCMSPCAVTSISMEGKQVWIVKSLPIPVKAWLDSKMLLNLSLVFPFYAVSVTVSTIGLHMDALSVLWMVLLPACILLFAVVFAITVNLRFHSFDWDKEETVVKQSLPSALGGFLPLLFCLLLGVAIVLVPAAYTNALKGGICLILLSAAALLYRKNSRVQLTKL